MEIVFATNNENKLREIREILGEEFKILSLQDIGCFVDIPENEPTIEGNAKAKSEYVYKNYQIDCFADDTGLEVESLDGRPGVKSARYAGEGRDMEANIDKVLEELKTKNNRNAQFKTVISLLLGGREVQFTGIVEGKILEQRVGKEGFGYDPVFKPKGYEHTFAQMTPREKNKISHRGIAVQKLAVYLKANA